MTKEELIILNRMIGMRSTLDLYESQVLKHIYGLYNSAVKDIKRDLVKSAKSGATWTNARQKALLQEAEAMLSNISEVLAPPIAQASGNAGQYTAQEMNNIVSWDQKVAGFNNISLSAAQLGQLALSQKLGGKVLKDWIGGSFQSITADIEAEIKKGYIKGESAQKIVNRIANGIGSKKSKRDIESIVQTYIHSMSVGACQDVYEANKDIVSRVEWSAILEVSSKYGRGTCPRCAALDGDTWLTDDFSRPPCPLHVKCRCLLLPKTQSWRELGFDIDEMDDEYKVWLRRDDKGRLVEYGDTDDNFADWWKTRSKKYQDNVVGPVRAEMIRTGQIKFKDIVDNRGNLILLKDLEVRQYPGREAILRGYGFTTLSKQTIFDKPGEYGTYGKILSVSDECDE